MTQRHIVLLVVAALLNFSPSAFAAQETPAEVIAAMELPESAKAVRDMPGWKKPKKVVVIVDGPDRLAWMKETIKGVELVAAPNARDALKLMGDADVVIGACQADLIDAAPKLKWAHSMPIGVDRCVGVPRVKSGDVLVSNSMRLAGNIVAEHTIGLMVMLAREMHFAVDDQRKHNWHGGPVGRKLVDLSGKTILINGLGSLGTGIAKRAAAFDMKVIATRASSREGPPFVSRVGLASELGDMVPEADVIVNAVPLTPETRGVFNAAMFARMKPTAYFINIARGESVVTADLIAALQAGKIAGAGLDVFDPEPLPADNPLWDMKNVIITGHYAGYSELRDDRIWIVARENLRRYVAGDKMLSLVDAKRGY